MERLKEIDIIRTFVIILLVLYHALAPYCGGWKGKNSIPRAITTGAILQG